MNKVDTAVLKDILYEKNVVIEEKIAKTTGELVIKRFLRGKLLGKGAFARCYEVTDMHSKKIYAAKIISKALLEKNKARQKLISEIKIHKSFQHPGIVKFEHVFEDQENVYILLEICNNESLKELLKRRKRLSEIEVQCYLLHILSTVQYLHSKLVIHRDLKLGNFFLNSQMELKLGDFGLACKLSDGEQRRNTVCGTPNYIAPEILETNGNGHSYAVDIWSIGVIIYTLLVGKPPFEACDVQSTYKKIKQRSYSFPENIHISDSVKNLLKKIFTLENERIKLNDIMNHEFLQKKNLIPTVMPSSTLNCPPSLSYTKNASFAAMISITMKSSKTNQTIDSKSPENIESQAQNKNLSNLGYFNELKTMKKVPISQPYETKNLLINENFHEKILPSGLQTYEKDNPRTLNDQFQNKCLVLNWVDYSNKYGIGYLLNNGYYGVFFNDSTKMLMKEEDLFYYIEKNRSESEQLMPYSINNCPLELNKKAVLMKHFVSYLNENLEEYKENIQEEQEKSTSLVYVKKWMKTSQAMMFRLSNKLIQVIFIDKTQLILNSDEKTVMFIGKNNVKKVSSFLSTFEGEDQELSNRLKYTKEILAHMITNSNKEKK